MPNIEELAAGLNDRFAAHHEKYLRQLSRIVLRISVLAGVSFLLGCGYGDKYPSHFQSVEGRPNTFRMFVIGPVGLFESKERVREVRVFEVGVDANGTKVRCLRWEVVATSCVFAEGLEVVAGQVPQGFTQIFPAQGETFKPVPGKDYEIAATMDHPQARPLGAETPWVAE